MTLRRGTSASASTTRRTRYSDARNRGLDPGWGSRTQGGGGDTKREPKITKGEDCTYNLPPHLWSLPVGKDVRLNGGLR